MEPSVSILIPVYNREAFIADCIRSALDQTVSDIEVVVVDNASSDNTWDICRQFAKRDKRVRIFRNSSNLGPVRNWQRCFAEARGAFGKILFSDDLMHPACLEKMLSYMGDDKVGFAFSPAVIGTSPWRGRVAYHWLDRSGIYASSDFIDTAFFGSEVLASPGAALFRVQDLHANLVLDIPSPSFHDFVDHGAGPDLLLYLLTAQKYPKVAFVAEPLSFFRDHAGSITSQEGSGPIHHRHLQAKIWFASQLEDDRLLKRLLAREWLKSCLRERTLISFSHFHARFLAEPVSLSPMSLVWSIGSLLGKGFARRHHLFIPSIH